MKEKKNQEKYRTLKKKNKTLIKKLKDSQFRSEKKISNLTQENSSLRSELKLLESKIMSEKGIRDLEDKILIFRKENHSLQASLSETHLIIDEKDL